MNYRKRLGVLIFSLLLTGGVIALGTPDVSAQRTVRRVVYRPIIVRRPYIYRGWYDPFYDPYFYDPYLRERRDRYYAEQRVARERRDMAEHREKYSADGYIDEKERKQMISDREQLAKAQRDLRRYTRRY